MRDSPRADDNDADLGVIRRDTLANLSHVPPNSEAELAELALGRNSPDEARSPTAAVEGDQSDGTFEDFLNILKNRRLAPANDDRVDQQDSIKSISRLKIRLKQTLRLLVASSLLLLASGLLAQTDFASVSHYARYGIWVFSVADVLLAVAAFSGLADLNWEPHRPNEADLRDSANRAARHEETTRALDLLRIQTGDMASALAQLHAKLAELATTPRLDPAAFTLFSAKTETQLARLSARLAEERTCADGSTGRDTDLIEALDLLAKHTQGISGDVADLRLRLRDIAAVPRLEPSHIASLSDRTESQIAQLAERLADLFKHTRGVGSEVADLRLEFLNVAAIPKLEPSHLASLSDQTESQIAQLAERLADHDRTSARTVTELRGAIETAQAKTMETLLATQALMGSAPVANPCEAQTSIAGSCDGNAFCDGLAILLGGGTTLSDERRSLLQNARSTLDTMFDLDALLLAWDTYRTDGRADFGSIYKPDFVALMPALRRRLNDATFRQSVEVYLDDYEHVLTTSAATGSDASLLRDLWNWKGRCYTLLAHAFRRLASVEDS